MMGAHTPIQDFLESIDFIGSFLRVATFYSAGRTWVGFLHRTLSTNISPTFACRSPPHSISFSSSPLARRAIVLPTKIP
ncbi:MAG: hypothetical protein H0U76_26350 [Ktedonobacteraceae bacterium]|nr:hypothetical protein [Ktedonobacteraceae bacterium]